MDDMHEIVEVAGVESVFRLIALALPLVGLFTGLLMGRRHGAVRAYTTRGFVCGLVGPMNLLLWHVYNAITDRVGLDRVSNLFINLALFVGLGVVIGIASRRVKPLPRAAAPGDSAGSAGQS